ncbi:MAG: DUF3090 domain-containing protein, partial [Nocardioidaceae bacterium]
MLIHRYDLPHRFVAGTVGAPGERSFFLQAREGNRLTTVSLEKEQVAVLADRLDALLAEALDDDESSEADPVAEDTAPLDQPIEEEFQVGVMTLAWEGSDSAVVIEAFAATEDEEAEASDVLVVQLTAPAARGFAERARSVVSAGRAQCQFCG